MLIMPLCTDRIVLVGVGVLLDNVPPAPARSPVPSCIRAHISRLDGFNACTLYSRSSWAIANPFLDPQDPYPNLVDSTWDRAHGMIHGVIANSTPLTLFQ